MSVKSKVKVVFCIECRSKSCDVNSHMPKNASDVEAVKTQAKAHAKAFPKHRPVKVLSAVITEEI